MPHACTLAASGVIGNELFIAGGNGGDAFDLTTLQIYDFTARTWRLGAPLPNDQQHGACGIVVGDGKLYVVSSRLCGEQCALMYDVQSDTWTEQPVASYDGQGVMHAFAHKGRIVAVNARGTAFHRGTGTDPSADVFWPAHWRRFDLDMTPGIFHGVAGSILFG